MANRHLKDDDFTYTVKTTMKYYFSSIISLPKIFFLIMIVTSVRQSYEKIGTSTHCQELWIDTAFWKGKWSDLTKCNVWLHVDLPIPFSRITIRNCPQRCTKMCITALSVYSWKHCFSFWRMRTKIIITIIIAWVKREANSGEDTWAEEWQTGLQY